MTLHSEVTVEDACLTDDELATVLQGDATPSLLDRAHEHAETCDPCHELLAHAGRVRAAEQVDDLARTLTEVGGWRPQIDAVWPSPQKIGRFEVQHRLGEGGMGVVYAALDAQLGRTVAIKLLRDWGAADPEHGQARLLREARAMAQVEHPNVLSVHEVGLHNERVFIVMDFVDGSDLAEWLEQRPRAWSEIVDAFVAAGEGLAAVHDHGLVHRDFKAHNVLIRKDGRVQVTDFGLVGAAAQAEDEVDIETLQGVLGTDRTAVGSVVGTPRYMAPEQFEGRPVTVASDQFSFCVSLWEALTGHHPFEIERRDQSVPLRYGTIKPVPRGSIDAPARLLSVLRCGLARAPEERHASMRDLLRALRQARDAPKHRRRVAIVGGLVGLAAMAGAWLSPLGRDPQLCAAPAGGDFEGQWDESRAQRVLTLRRRVDPPEVVGRLERELDDYSQRWSEARVDACEATRVRGEASLELLDRRMACLHTKKAAFSTTVDVLEEDGVVDPLMLVYGLPALSVCRDLAGSSAEDERPSNPAVAQSVLDLEGELAAADVLRSAGRATEARQQVERIVAEAETIGWAPLYAMALSRIARLERDEEPIAALETWRKAFVVAMRSDAGVSYSVALDGVDAHVRVQQLEQAELFADVAEARAEVLGHEPYPGDLANNRALLAGHRNDLPEAERQLRAAISATERDPERRAALMFYRMNLVGVLASQGRLDEARGEGELALELSRDLFGDGHPNTLRAQINAANVDFAAGDLESAARTAERVAERWGAHEHPVDQAVAYDLHARALLSLGRVPECLAPAEQALRLRRAALAPGDPLIPRSLGIVARCMLDGGRVEEAIRVLDEALGLLEDGSSPQLRDELEATRGRASQRRRSPDSAVGR